MEGSLFDFLEEKKPEPPVISTPPSPLLDIKDVSQEHIKEFPSNVPLHKNKKEIKSNQNLSFLSLFTEKLQHHCILIPSIYSIQNCKLLLEFLSIEHQKSVEEITSHPDFFFYTEFMEKQVPIKVEDARDILMFAQNTGFSGKKVIVIDKIEEATVSALNCLLKIIEEPPANTFFYLIYSSENLIPATIRSRSATIREKITNQDDFSTICSFFAEENSNFQLFVQSGYDMYTYNQLISVQDFSFSQIKKKLTEKVDESFTNQVQIFLEKNMNRIAIKANSHKDINMISSIMQRLLFLRKSIETLNTNKQLALLEITENIGLLLKSAEK